MFKKSYFITATGTDIGKTCTAALLLHKYPQFHYWKPVQTGKDIDRIHIIDLLKRNTKKQNYKSNELTKNIEERFKNESYFFEAPLSPNQAAQKEQTHISINKLLNDFKTYSQGGSPLLLEGAGGLMVPLFSKYTWVDFLKDTGLSVILVSSTRLGTINHTLLSLFALQKNLIPISGLVFCGPENPENIKTILEWGEFPVLSYFDFHQLEDMDNITCLDLL